MGSNDPKYRRLIEELNIPGDHSRQTNATTLVKKVYDQHPNLQKVLDLGCGMGNSVDFFKALDPKIEWIGLDVEKSQEVDQRYRSDATFFTFDGINIPFKDHYFDLIFCNQVLEHVRYPLDLLRQSQRVLKIGGKFVGSTSHLEPYHSYSTYNYTPYGFKRMMEDAGFRIVEFRPGIDGLTLIVRAVFGRPLFFRRWWNIESPLNMIIEMVGGILKKENREINFAKLMLCGQFCFIGEKNNRYNL